MTTQQTVNQAPPRGTPTPVITQGALSPPSKRELASWWKKFRKTTEKEDEKRGSSISLTHMGAAQASPSVWMESCLTKRRMFFLFPPTELPHWEKAVPEIPANH
jgi:hypothetical protein